MGTSANGGMRATVAELKGLVLPDRSGAPRIAPADPRQLRPLARIVAEVGGRITGTGPANIFTTRALSDSTWSAVQATLSKRESIELCVLIGNYQGLASAIGGLGIQIETDRRSSDAQRPADRA